MNDSETTPECAICYEKLDNSAIKLKCGHTFHYNCIFNSYKMSTVKNNVKLFRKCPYCRNNGGFLPIRENIYPHKNIHIEYYEIEQHLIRNDFDKLKQFVDKYIDKTKCNAILKSGINKGYQCKKNKKKYHDYCHLHLN